MVSDLLFYELLLLGLLWLCVLLYYAWPSDCPIGNQRTPTCAKPPRKRFRDPKPFPGLTCKPLCTACEQAYEYTPQPPGCPPPRIVPTRGCPRHVDTSTQFCPHLDGDDYGWAGFRNLQANGHPSGRLECPRISSTDVVRYEA